MSEQDHKEPSDIRRLDLVSDEGPETVEPTSERRYSKPEPVLYGRIQPSLLGSPPGPP